MFFGLESTPLGSSPFFCLFFVETQSLIHEAMFSVETSLAWKPCSSCKQPIGLNVVYWVCNVSTCNRKRTGLVFCSVDCWDAHVPLYNHRESWALESRSPKVRDAEDESLASKPSEGGLASKPKKVISDREKFVLGLDESTEKKELIMADGNAEKEVLIVASKLKNYIRAKSEMNTSAAVTDVLSDKIRELCDQAIENAKRDGRKTVMDRDFQ